MQPKAKTLQERMGFRDDELSTPRHDEIMLWLDENVERLLAAAKPWSNTAVEEVRSAARKTTRDAHIKEKWELACQENSTDKFDTWERRVKRKEMYAEIQSKAPLAESFSWVLNADPPCPVTKVEKTWELPVLSGTYTVGFIDMRVTISDPWLDSDLTPEGCFTWSMRHGHGEPHFIEVKPKIESLGEVIRQIRFYQTHCQGEFYVCCPDNRFEKQLAAQGIGFIRAEI